MPLKLTVGVSRKIGLPEYSSAGASCNIEVELSNDLLQHSPDAFQTQVREAFGAAQQAVNDELDRLRHELAPVAHAANPGARNGNGHVPEHVPRRNALPAPANGPRARNGSHREAPLKPCTLNQVRAIRAIARNLNLDLEEILREDFGVELPDQLSLAQASTLIDTLKAANDS